MGWPFPEYIWLSKELDEMCVDPGFANRLPWTSNTAQSIKFS
jgi:hypothetical protein